MIGRLLRKSSEAQDNFMWRIDTYLKKNPTVKLEPLDKKELIKAYEKGDIDKILDIIKF